MCYLKATDFCVDIFSAFILAHGLIAVDLQRRRRKWALGIVQSQVSFVEACFTEKTGSSILDRVS